MISGLASSRDQCSAFDTLRSQVTKSPQTNSKGASKATFLQVIENTMTAGPADKQTIMCGSNSVVKNACAHLKSEHAHNWALKLRNACAQKNPKTDAHTRLKFQKRIGMCTLALYRDGFASVVMTTHGCDVHALPSLGPNLRRRRTGSLNRLQRCGPCKVP